MLRMHLIISIKYYMKNLIVLFLLLFATNSYCQELPGSLESALSNDDSLSLSRIVSPSNIDDCYKSNLWAYTAVSLAVRYGASNCLDLLLSFNADVNKVCDGYLPPLMFAAKYGRLAMVKKLIKAGADVSFVYHGEYTPADGLNALAYAEKFQQSEVAEYLRGL